MAVSVCVCVVHVLLLLLMMIIIIRLQPLAEAKYATLQTHYVFQPIAVETLGLINESATSFLYNLGQANFARQREDRETQFFFVSTPYSFYLHDCFLSLATRISVCFRL